MRDADRRQQEKLQEGTVSVLTAFLFLSKCFLMALSMQDAFAASILPVFSEKLQNGLQLCMSNLTTTINFIV